MNDVALAPLNRRFWRMIRVAYHRDPFSGEGARLFGGRWNATGTPALYLAADHVTAVREFYRGGIVQPGTLTPYDLAAASIADLTDGKGGPRDAEIAVLLEAEWKLTMLDRVPRSWTITEGLIAEGAEGALVPSTQNPGGTNLVLWRWYDARAGGDGAALTLVDPQAELAG